MGGRLWVSRHLTERMCWCQWLSIGKRGDGSFPYISSTCCYLRCSLGFKSCCDIIPYCFSSCYAIFSSLQRIHFFHLFQCTWICVCVLLWEVKNSTKQLLEISSTNLVAVIDFTASLLGVIELIFTAFRVWSFFSHCLFILHLAQHQAKPKKKQAVYPTSTVMFSFLSCRSHQCIPPPINASLFATHLMAMCCPGLWLMATIQPDKFPWVGASWLTQRRNSLLLSAELTA